MCRIDRIVLSTWVDTGSQQPFEVQLTSFAAARSSVSSAPMRMVPRFSTLPCCAALKNRSSTGRSSEGTDGDPLGVAASGLTCVSETGPASGSVSRLPGAALTGDVTTTSYYASEGGGSQREEDKRAGPPRECKQGSYEVFRNKK